MKLCYFDDNVNFGDALNATIFPTLLADFFDEDPSVSFFGIGSLFGLPLLENSSAVRKIIFSTGYGKYGVKPRLDSSYEIMCVRGPLTAEYLGLDKSMAVADGALLLSHFSFPSYKKTYAFSYMPHWESETRFDWAGLCEQAGYHYISPMWHKDRILEEILKSEVIITEAMHGAIVADTLRVPWIPVKGYKNISEFKWQDWTQSIQTTYNPVQMPPLYSEVKEAEKIIQVKTKGMLGDMATQYLAKAFVSYQKNFKWKETLKQFADIKNTKPSLSQNGVVTSLADELRDRLEKVKSKYTTILS
ncbi:polysaccharide pyruvyl transferase family protein [Xanthocytophaga agilis]|uniref:Polysaccharide pyruvyl transferase family protein n=1 Tax=Xanthocytophaga agilis TaxID=3048010 RepID=A0AAE3R5U3_9BACT|nr:polysaccharide pyruvyl transferase family protein [Xanthocytophaga agilis]MDJ1502009.1 polysaccharide pyruvyl transferase family protein [Xanthocytophaga agilis]